MPVLGQNGKSVVEEVVLLESQTYTALRSGVAVVHCMGGGGEGGHVITTGNTTNQNLASATGGGAGGYSRKEIYIETGDTFTVVVGAGGRTSSVVSNSSTQGVAGGESTFDHASATATIALDSNGGAGGVATNAQTAGGQVHAGGAGGTASGGDVNYAGGRGGNITKNNNSVSTGAFCTGGGAVAIKGVSYNGGNAIQGGNNNHASATGGAGIGGGGGDFTCNANTNCRAATSGGSSSKSAEAVVGTGTLDSATGATFALPDVHGNLGYGGCGQFTELAGSGSGISGGSFAYAAIDLSIDPAYKMIFNSTLGRGPTNLTPETANPGTNGIAGSVGGGGGGTIVDSNTESMVCHGGNGSWFAGGGGGLSLGTSNPIKRTNGQISGGGLGGIGGGGGGGFRSATSNNVAGADRTIAKASGGQGCIIIQFLG
tara:strand:+ start:39 stop:1325 length:1287 start_codon:yes stop_codon:yes gene_type:complete